MGAICPSSSSQRNFINLFEGEGAVAIMVVEAAHYLKKFGIVPKLIACEPAFCKALLFLKRPEIFVNAGVINRV
jgi:hypothetical protein